MFPERNYTLDLQNHFEFFLDVPGDDIEIEEKVTADIVKVVKYKRHQVCLMVTYDIINYCHRIEVILMPSFKDMKDS